MPQMHFSVSESEAAAIRRRAKAHGMTVSKYLASLVRSQVHAGWPEGYFENVLGSWQGPPLAVPRGGEPEEREALCPTS